MMYIHISDKTNEQRIKCELAGIGEDEKLYTMEEILDYLILMYDDEKR